jgi:hypothetical protein
MSKDRASKLVKLADMLQHDREQAGVHVLREAGPPGPSDLSDNGPIIAIHFPGAVNDEVETSLRKLAEKDKRKTNAMSDIEKAAHAGVRRALKEVADPYAPAVTPAKHAKTLSKEAMALAALADHPDWTDEQVAQAAGCQRGSLYRMPKYVAAKRVLKDRQDLLPRGYQNRETGNVEASDDDGGGK